MSRVQIILTPSGERLAIMPAEDYEALVARNANSPEDDSGDLARIDEIVAARAEGKSGSVSLDAMKRILAGESPIRVWRNIRGLTQGELAAKARLGVSAISMMENGKRTGSPAALKRIAGVLGVDLDELVN